MRWDGRLNIQKKVCEFALESKLVEKDEIGNLLLTERGRKKLGHYTTS